MNDLNVPKIDYCTSYEEMSIAQKEFFKKVQTSIDDECFIDVEENDWYIDYCIENIVCNWKTYGLVELRRKLLQIGKKYNSYFANLYANDCLLGLKRYNDFLENTKINNILDHQLDIIYGLRLSVQKKLGIDADPLDIYFLQYPSRSKIIKSNPELFKGKVIEVFKQYAVKNKGWFNLIDSRFKDIVVPIEHKLLETHVSHCKKSRPQLDLVVYNYFSLAIGKNGINSILKQLSTKAENLVRNELGLPKKNVAWTMETFLYEYLQKEFSGIELIQHGQPDWLGKQHYDIWIPEYKIAIEYHGEQHFKPIKKWGGEEAFLKTQERDLMKKNLSIENGVNLFVVSISDGQSELVKKIKAIIGSKEGILHN